MYFVGGDYFKNYGIQKAGVMLDAPGLILPVIHQKEGRPVFRVTLTEPLKDAACILRCRPEGWLLCHQRQRRKHRPAAPAECMGSKAAACLPLPQGWRGS